MDSPEATETTPAPAATDDESRRGTGAPQGRPTGRPWLAALLAWVVPGLGHLYLRRWVRSAVFAAVVLAAVAAGVLLGGELWSWSTPGTSTVLGTTVPVAAFNVWMHRLFAVVAMGMGSPWFVLQAVGYRGDVVLAGYEYGTVFFFTAALMNLLLVLDAWDVSRGRKP